MTKSVIVLVAVLALTASAAAQQTSLQDLVNRAAKTTLDRFADKKLQESELSITLIDMRDPRRTYVRISREPGAIVPSAAAPDPGQIPQDLARTI